MKKIFAIAAVGVATFVSVSAADKAPVAKAGAADGKTLYTQKACNSCHGDEGKKPLSPTYPKLNGQNADYAKEQMKLIRDKKRTSGLSSAMQGLVATITDAEFEAIAKYLESVK